MEYRQYFWILLMIANCHLFGQAGIRTHNDFTAQTLVKDIFASGACDNIDLITTIGHADGIGYFENGMDVVGLDRGIIFSTGPTQYASGPNDATDKSGNLPGSGGDADLNQLTGGGVADASGIEFDFVPLDSIVRFRYVFASEEYCEFVGSDYNDVFGFFISGPGINGPFDNGAENVALIPGSSDFVAINSVNFLQHSDFYIHNERNEDLDNCDLASVPRPHLETIQYDGFTTVLTAELRLRPCETYHIRLVVGDVADPFFDSAVFLEAGSFNLGGEIAVTAIGETAGAGQVFEGCEDAAFRFSRSADSPLDLPLTVNYELSPASTATPGLDYEPFSGSITIPQGDLYADLPLRSIPDAAVEDEELVRLVLDIPCACYADSAEIVIVPPPELNVSLEDAYTCPGEPALLTAEVNGGVFPYTYLWPDGGNASTQEVPGIAGIWYEISVTDACQQMVNSTATIHLTTPPAAQLSGDVQICQGDTALLPLELEGVPPFSISFEHNGTETTVQLGDVANFPVTLAGQYQLTGITDAACAGLATGTAHVAVWELDAAATISPVRCAGLSDGAITVAMNTGLPPFSFQWQDIGATTNAITDLPAALYQLEVTDARACSRIFEWEVPEPEPLRPPEVDCEKLFEGVITAGAGGGSPPYRYQTTAGGAWNTQDDWLSDLTEGESYTLLIRDENDCELETAWLMPAPYPQGMAALTDLIKLPLGVTTPVDWQNFVPENLLATITWSPADQLSCNDCLEPEITARQSGFLKLYLEDVFGCQQELSTELLVEDRVDVFLPNAFSPNGDDQNDQWLLYGNPLQVERIEELLIFDRWGNLVFHADDWPINSERHGWDGTFHGQPLDPGVFAYAIRLRLVNGERRTLGGDVLLLR